MCMDVQICLLGLVQAEARCLPQSLLQDLFIDSGARSLARLIGMNKNPGNTLLSVLQCWDCKCVLLHLAISFACWGSKLRSLCLYSRHYPLIILPSPWAFDKSNLTIAYFLGIYREIVKFTQEICLIVLLEQKHFVLLGIDLGFSVKTDSTLNCQDISLIYPKPVFSRPAQII